MGLLTKNNALALDDGKLALNTAECRAKCGCGCWYPVYQCVCDDRGVATVNFFWPCNWEIPLDNLETQRFPSFQFEDLCYNIFLDSPVTSIPEGDENQEFPESEVGALQWFDSCAGDPAQPDVITGCCDTCYRDCDTVCSSAYTATANLSFSAQAETFPGIFATIEGPCEEQFTAVISNTGGCIYFGTDENSVCTACEMQVGPDGGPYDVYPVEIESVDFNVHHECDPASSTDPGDFDPYWVLTVTATLCVDDPCDPVGDCSFAGTGEISFTFTKGGPCPGGSNTWTLVSTYFEIFATAGTATDSGTTVVVA